ncbi:rod shape-determining protein [Actinomadura sp. 9N407]|uniref:rod shape-determining protein n=1 Tax=Actinomadura sp. 9N407 TaxID=3375154 RepID=UPI00378DE8B2
MKSEGSLNAGRQAALDLGSSRTRVIVPSGGVIVDQPSRLGGAPVTGRRSGRRSEGDVNGRWPIRHGVVADASGCTRLTRRVLGDIATGILTGTATGTEAVRSAEAPDGTGLDEVLLGVPVTATPSQRNVAAVAVEAATGCPVTVMEAPLAAAIGSGLDVAGPRPRLIMDIGAGVVEIVVIAHGRILGARAIQYEPQHSAGRPRPHIPDHVLQQMADVVHRVIGDLPSGTRPAVRRGGLVLTGGGARTASLPGRLTTDMRLMVSVAPDPAWATVRGLARMCARPA